MKLIVMAIAALVTVTAVPAALPLAGSAPVDICGIETSQLLGHLAEETLGRERNARLLALNDVRCGDQHHDGTVVHMANIAMSTGGDEVPVYGIFHVHFSPRDGVPRSVARVVPWTPQTASSWRKAWCRFVEMAYAAEAAEQGCAQSAPAGDAASTPAPGDPPETQP